MKLGQCFLCGAASDFSREFCPSCLRGVSQQLYNRNRSQRRVSGLPLLAAGPYAGNLQRYLLRLKSSPMLSTQNLGFLDCILEYWALEAKALGASAVVAVPSGFLRHHLGPCLSRYLALRLATYLKIPLLYPPPRKGLWHEWRYGPQKSKDLKRRRRFAPSFVVPTHSLPRGAQLLLVDDLCSSGLSFESLAAALKRQGFEVVGAFALLENSRFPT